MTYYKKTYREKLLDPRWQKKSGIYSLCIAGNIYIGSAVSLPKRLRQHYNDLKAGRHKNIHLQRAYNKYQEISFDIIEIIESHSDLIPAEQRYIDSLNPHYNIAKTAGSQLGFKHSEASKRKISQVQIGKNISSEARAAMSAARKGIKLSDSHRINIANAKKGDKNPFYRAGVNHPQFGTKRNPETIKKLSGRNNPSSKSGVIYDVETGANYVFQSLRSMCSRIGLTYRGVLSALRKEKFYKGRYYASFIDVPKDCETTKINPSI